MAKQTFTTGQVLTAAQMTSLQQTAMGGGSTTAKTASYVLVAADAGTVVQMNAAGATTITVNTALFAAGDTVQIQNVGTGVCTVTAGTATVSTSSTLALKQYDAGTLYFNTTSAALFFAVDAADSTSPLTTKGDLYGYSTLDARIPIGTNNQVLTADSAQALGLKWATPASGGGLTVIATGTLSGTSVVISSIPATYKHLMVSLHAATWNTANDSFMLRYNSVTTNYVLSMYGHTGTTALNSGSINAIGWYLNDAALDWDRISAENHANWIVYDYNNTTGVPHAEGSAIYLNSSSTNSKVSSNYGNIATAAAITSLTLGLFGGRTMTAGTYTVYGVS